MPAEKLFAGVTEDLSVWQDLEQMMQIIYS
jgi:hypothetical protein